MIEVVKQIAREAGDVVMKYYKGDYEVAIKNDKKSSPVTTADLESEKLIIRRLKEEFDFPVFSEESLQEEIDWNGKVWVVDPIDGTVPFMKNKNYWCILIGLSDKGKAVLGVIYFPVLGEIFWSEKGKGAFMESNGEVTKLKVNEKSNLSSAKFYGNGNELDYLIEMGATRVAEADCGGSHAASLLKGEVELYVRGPLSGKWDSVALHVAVEEAGGKVSTLKGKKFEYKKKNPLLGTRLAYTNSAIHDKLISSLGK